MKTCSTVRSAMRAMTLVELLVTLAIVGILAALLLPSLAKGRSRATQIKCVSQLKQVGLGFHVFAHDHNNLFPMRVSGHEGGTMEYVQSTYAAGGDTYFSYRHLQVLSETLKDPKLVCCPADTRVAARTFDALKNENVSYFVAPTAAYNTPSSILAGDRNITNNLGFTATLMGTGFTVPIGWTHELHQFRGNLLFADGRVEQSSRGGLVLAWNKAGGTPNLLVFPSTPTGPPPNRPPAGGLSRPGPASPDEVPGSREAQFTSTTGSSGTASRTEITVTAQTDSPGPQIAHPASNLPAPARAAPEESEAAPISEPAIHLMGDLSGQMRNLTYLWLLVLLILALVLRLWL